MNRLALSLVVLLNVTLFGAYRVVPVAPTPESESVVLTFVFPKEGENYTSSIVKSQMRLRGYPLSVMSNFERAMQLRSNGQGQTVHVIIDNNQYFTLDKGSLYNFDQQRAFYDNVLNFKIPYNLSQGEHLIRAFPARSYGESIKDPESFAIRLFYVKDPQRKNLLKFDPSAPLLTYNEPQGSFDVSETQPILLDFYITNCRLSENGYRVRLKIDGKQQAIITRWVPYYMYGFTKGSHTVTLELIDKKGKKVPGEFNKIKRIIYVQ